MASTGGKQAIFNSLVATVEAGDEVIIPSPLLDIVCRYHQVCGWHPGYRSLCGRK